MPKFYESDTIAAITTPMGEGGIGIVRLSGDRSCQTGERIFRRKAGGAWESHKLYYGHVVDPESRELIDEALCVLMKSPRSYTREDVLELHCHGGSLVTQRVFELVLREGVRPAQPGEFTKRAFLNGRIDLTQAEAVIDLIRAKTSIGQAVAAEHLTGRLNIELSEIKNKLSSVVAHSEAYIDFPEEDIELSTREDFLNTLSEIEGQLKCLLSSYEEGKVYRDGVSAVIAGRPNVGKSSLLNILLKEKRAIVTSIPGTTRDVIEEYVNIKGVPMKLADTAGIRETDDIIEKEGVRLAREILDRADFAIFVIDGSRGLINEDLKLLEELGDKKYILAVNKSDMPLALSEEDVRRLSSGNPVVFISALTGDGIESLYESIFLETVHRKREPSGGLVITRARHRDSLHKALTAVKYCMEGIQRDISPELYIIDLRTALDAIGEVVGDTTPDDILEKIFNEFCIGK